MTPQPDPELEGLLDDPELREVARLLRSMPRPQPEPDRAFRAQLRRQLMQEAWRLAEPRPRWYQRLFSGPALAWSAAAVGVLLVVITLFVQSGSGGTTTMVSYGSKLDDARQVALVQPIDITFSGPMDKQSVEKSVEISPATQVHYEWPAANVLRIVPANGSLAPNTQYQVTVAGGAKSQNGQPLAGHPPVTFVTTSMPPAAPPPPATPPTGISALIGERQVSPAGAPALRWSADGSILYVVGSDGSLSALPVAGGPAQKLAADGVTLVVTGPEGVGYARGKDVVFNQQSYHFDAAPAALGIRGGRPLALVGRDVLAADRGKVATLAEDARGADFAPGGDHLAYLGASGLRLVDLTSGRDVLVGPATALGDWSPDGRRYAFAGDAVYVTDGGQPVRIADVTGVTGIAWSRGDQLLLTTAASLSLVGSDGGGLRKVGDVVVTQPAWAPTGNVVAYKRSGSAWTAQVSNAVSASGLSQDDLLQAFMKARQADDPDTAAGYLDPAGKEAFKNLELVYEDRTIARYYVLLSQPGHAVIRVVLGQDRKEIGAVDEALLLQRDSAGKLLIHGAGDSATRPLGRGPDPLYVQVTRNQVTVLFDSDLDAATVAAGVQIKGVAGQAAYDKGRRAVTLTLSGSGLAPGTNHLLVTPDLRDIGHRPAAAWDLEFTAPTT